jgi:hypothetical protein
VATLQIATVGGDDAPVLLGLRDHPVAKVYLLHHPDAARQAQDLREKLKGLMIEGVVRPVDPDTITGTLRVVGEIVAAESKRFDHIVANIAGGSPLCGCSLLMAAFVHGIEAIHIVEGKSVKMPVLRFSYTQLIGDEKFRILDAIEAAGGASASLDALAQATGLTKAAVARHLKNARDPPGLEDLGVVEIRRGGTGLTSIEVTASGKLLLVGRHPGHSHG